MKKRMFAILVAVMLVLTMLPTSAFAVSASAWFNGPGTVRAGDTITLGFCVSGTNIFGASGSLSYDSSQLTLLGTAQSIGSPWVVELNGPNFVAYDNNLVAPINGGTTLIRATFQVNNVAPGVIYTDRNVEALSDAAYAEKVKGLIPVGFYGEPEDCAAMVRLLCSEQGRYITGQSIYVDGGKSVQ